MIILDLIKEQYSIKMAQTNVQLSFISPIHRKKETVHSLCEEIKNWGFSRPFSSSRAVICLLWPDECGTEHRFLSLVGHAGQLEIFPFATGFIFIVLKKHSGWTCMGSGACLPDWWDWDSFFHTCTHLSKSIKASKLNGKRKKGEKCWY